MRRLAIGLVVALALLPVSGAEGSVAVAPRTGDAGRDTGAAWLPPWAGKEGISAVERAADLVETTSPFWYDATDCHRVVVREGGEDASQLARLRAAGMRIVPTVTATGLTPPRAISCFRDDGRRAAHVRALTDLASSRGYDGLDLNYEHLALTTSVPQARRVRQHYGRFAEDLCRSLRRDGRTCSVTVMPRTGDRPVVWRGKLLPFVYDYTALGRVADELRVMAYDQHAHAYGPGPIAGMPWVRRVADYVARRTEVSGVRLGVPTYGRDFARGKSVSLTGSSARALARRHGRRARFHRKQQEATFSYRSGGVRHVVWFSSPRAVARRTAFARARGFRGSVYWAAGLEMPGTWNQVRR